MGYLSDSVMILSQYKIDKGGRAEKPEMDCETLIKVLQKIDGRLKVRKAADGKPIEDVMLVWDENFGVYCEIG